MTINDSQYKYLRSLGFEGALPDMLQQWLQTLVDIDSKEDNELWFQFFTDQGYTGALPDMWRSFILDQGYTDRADFWDDVANGLEKANL